jgi:hypothetical protein
MFEEQKIFLIYLMGTIPEMRDWKMQVSYETELEEIKSLKDVEISQSDIDIAKIQGRSLENLKAERLKTEKESKFKELREKYGLKPVDENVPMPEGIPTEVPKTRNPQEKLWDLLQGKGLISNGL